LIRHVVLATVLVDIPDILLIDHVFIKCLGHLLGRLVSLVINLDSFLLLNHLLVLFATAFLELCR